MDNKHITSAQVPGIPEGHYLVRIGQAIRGEKYLHYTGNVQTCLRDKSIRKNCIIVAELPKARRSAVMPQDFGKPAWFKDITDKIWTPGFLCGMTLDGQHYICEDRHSWNKCEVECDKVVTSTEEWIVPTKLNIGQLCIFTDDATENYDDWTDERKLDTINDNNTYPFVDENHTHWKYARIRNPNYVKQEDITPTQEHIGQLCQFTDDLADRWSDPLLLSEIHRITDFPFKDEDFTVWKHARLYQPKPNN